MAQDRPTAAELVEAVREFLEHDVMPIEGRVGFHGRVARNVLAILERELAAGEALDAAERARIVDLLGVEAGSLETVDMERELARRIRDGSLDDRRDEVVAAVRETVMGKLSVSNPAYIKGSGRTE